MRKRNLVGITLGTEDYQWRRNRTAENAVLDPRGDRLRSKRRRAGGVRGK